MGLKMTKMASLLCRSRDVFLKRPLIGWLKNCLTNCIKLCDSQKIDKFSPKCHFEVVPIWENNTNSTNGPSLRTTFSAYHSGYHSNIANMTQFPLFVSFPYFQKNFEKTNQSTNRRGGFNEDKIIELK